MTAPPASDPGPISEMPHYPPEEVHWEAAPATGYDGCTYGDEHVHIDDDGERFEVHIVNAWLHPKAASGRIFVARAPFYPTFWDRLMGRTLDNVVSLAYKRALAMRRAGRGRYDAVQDAQRRYGVRRSR